LTRGIAQVPRPGKKHAVVKRGHRFLAATLGNLAAVSAGRRLLGAREGRRPDPEAGEPLGAIRGDPIPLRGPRTSRLYTEVFPAEDACTGTVIFTHGWCLTEAVWHYQKRDLAGDDLALVTWDLPGHGHSSPVAPKHLSLDLAADALARVVEKHAEGGVILAGHSLGGVITLGYLARHPDAAAEIVRGAVLVSTPVMSFAHSVAGRWPGARLEARALGRVMQAVVESGLAERVLAADVGKEEITRLSYAVARVGFGRSPSPTQVRFIRDVIASVPPQVRADTYRTMTGHDLRPLLPQITTPTLVVIGTRDRLVNPEESLMLANRLPRGRPLIMEDVGHAAFLEAHQGFNAALRTFARTRLRARRAGG
jgi:pimeloyl-ACP methyl ester carboxylesterase